MARGILSEYGNDSGVGQNAPRARSGGEMHPKPTQYSPPKGPSSINDPQHPGLNGHNCGPAGTQGARSTGADGPRAHHISADNYGCCGSQGRH